MNIREVDARPYLRMLAEHMSNEVSFVLGNRVVVALKDEDKWRTFEQTGLTDREAAYAAIYLPSTIRAARLRPQKASAIGNPARACDRAAGWRLLPD
jgi:hypothetical protein